MSSSILSSSSAAGFRAHVKKSPLVAQGFGGGGTGVDPHAHQRAQHRTLISLVYTKTLTLAKSVHKYPRKHRDLSGVLEDAVEALDEFKDVEWPPRRSEMEEVLDAVPDWMGDDNKDDTGEKEDQAMSELDRQLARDACFSNVNVNPNEGTAGADAKRDKTYASDAALGEKLNLGPATDEVRTEELHEIVLSARVKESDNELIGEDEIRGIQETGNNLDSAEHQTGGMADHDALPEKLCETANDSNVAVTVKNTVNNTESTPDKSEPQQPPQPPSTHESSQQGGNRKALPKVKNHAQVDAAAMEPMHPAVITALHALCMVISSESKTPKMAELSLECITLLTNGRYVSGVAGGRMKLEQQRKMSELTRGENGGEIGHFMMGGRWRSESQQFGVQGGHGHDGRDGGLSFLGYVIESITHASDSSSEAVQGGMTKAFLAIMTCPKCGVHEAAMLQAVRSTFHVYLVGKTNGGKELAKRTLVDMLKCVFNRMEAYDIISKDEETTKKINGGGEDSTALVPTQEIDVVGTLGSASAATTNRSARLSSTAGTIDDPSGSIGQFASQYHTDSYLLFRALCKLSSKTLPGDENVGVTATGGLGLSGAASGVGGVFFSTAPTVDPLALNSKILSLELILAVFEHCGDAFRNGEKFVYAVQSYLCVSLLKNCMSNQTVVAHLSLKIFLLLVRKFKTHLKSEIEVFVANIFLRVLESPNSPFEQKVLVLEALRALCADPQMLTQLFLNYDCDFDAVNLYKDIVHHVTRISARACAPLTAASGSRRDVDQELDLSRTGLEVLVVILRSFLKSLGLPGGDDDFDETDGSSSLSLLRKNLKLDVGMNDLIHSKTSPRKNNREGTRGTPSFELEDCEVDSSTNSSSSSADVAVKIVDAFDRKRTAQQNFEIGMVKFTLSLKSGLLFFIENDFVLLDALDMARFLYEHKEKLDKTQIGEVLGKEPDAAFVKDENVDPEKGGKGFFLRILYHYVDRLEFTGLLFDDAIRFFLSGFRLPGEAQKIDRIMEKFAERYTRQNIDVFPSADTAFILAFSVIMLNTDLHNPSIKPERRMTLESFIRNNKGISVDGGDLPDEFLTGIFNRIKQKPFSLKEDDEAREKANKDSTRDLFDSLFIFEGPTIFGSSAEERKREKFRKEREEMMTASEQLFRKRPTKSNATRQSAEPSELTDAVSPADVVKPMFDVTWGPLIGTLSQVLESSMNETSIALCLSGFVYSIRLSSHSGMSLARNTFVNSLAKFTTLGSVKEMKSKNIECIRTLLSIAIIDGEYLGESWSPILQCISQLGRLHLFASGLDSEDKFLQTGSPQLTKISEAAREMEENNGKAVLAAVNEVLIDKVFSSTVTLSARGISSFIEQLVTVSDAEISGNTKKGISGVSSSSTLKGSQSKSSGSGHGVEGPRIFSLQRLVEVADYNMDIRPRLTWSQIWENMGRHIAKIGCNENAMVSMFAIDALRQLSFKFLEKPELTDFNFQRLFLKPFLLIMQNPGSREDIRELVLRCVDNIIRSLAHNLRSGWKIFFSILMLSSTDPSVKINTLGLAILQRLLDEHLDELCRLSGNAEDLVQSNFGDDNQEIPLTSLQRRQRNANAEDFVGLCRASLSFVQTEESENPLPIGLSMRALCHTACYADLVAERKVLPPVSGFQCNDPLAPGFTYDDLSEKESLEMAMWRPLLDGLASGMCSSAPSSSGGVGCLVQRGSVMALRAILLRHGHLFSVTQWSAILNHVVIPAIQIGAEGDLSPVAHISSESPSVSSLDFLGEPLPLPPACDDEGLQRFSVMAQTDESSPSRPLGVAELLVEASFADLRHGGDGDLSKAYSLKKKDVEKRIIHLQPFPDSWVATTAPIALGLLSDLIGEHFLAFGEEGREVLWPSIIAQVIRWSVGHHREKSPSEEADHDEYDRNETGTGTDEWQPCEALVRIGCKEWYRIFCCILNAAPKLNKEESQAWLKILSSNLSETLTTNVDLESELHKEIVSSKISALQSPNRNKQKNDFSKSHLKHDNGDSGTDGESGHYLDMLPRLKSKCIAAHCFQQYISTFVDQLAILTAEEEISHLLDALNQSRLASSRARKDEDLAHAFQEAFLGQWGDDVEDVEAAMQGTSGGSGRRGSSQMFFLTQEASATKAIIRLLSLLYCLKTNEKEDTNCWNSEAFAEPLLMKRMMDVLEEFIASEKRDGILVDPNVWRVTSEGSSQVAYFCTSFACVVVDILETISSLDREKFDCHKNFFFPVLCSLIRVQSDEIRQFVSTILLKQVGPLIGISSDDNQ